jgi:hypothetical protein
MKKLLVLALILVSVNAFAQTSTGPNGLGIYFEKTGMTNSKAYPTGGSTVTCYLVATHISQTNGLSEWEAHLYTTPNIDPETYTFTFNTPTACVNALTAPDFMVGVAPIFPTANAIWLVTFKFDLPDPVETVLVGVGPSVEATSFRDPISHLPLNKAGYGNGNSTLMTAFELSASSLPIPGVPGGYYVACVNGQGPVATSNDSWSGVKSLYR